MQQRSVLVIGAGVGGLCAALDLQARGHAVTVLEREADVGGKVRRLDVGGAPVDVGPAVLTLREALDGLLDPIGLCLDELVTLRPLDVLARHAWQDGSRLDLHRDPSRTEAAIGALAGAREAHGYRRFRAYAARIWEHTRDTALASQRPTLAAMMGRGVGGLRALLAIDARRSMGRALGDFFEDPRLLQLFGRHAGLAGSSPLQAPATLNLIAHVEGAGAWAVEGGMWQLVSALARAVERLGGKVRTGAPVARVLAVGGRAVGVELAGGERLRADAVVANADVATLHAGHLGPEARAAVSAGEVGERSPSVHAWALRARAEGLPLARQTILFSRDAAAELRSLFEERRLPADPTVTVYAQDRLDGDGGGAPERLLVLTAAPADGDRGAQGAFAADAARERAWRTLERCGLRLTPEASVAVGPRDLERLAPGTGGALYGAAATSWRATFERAPAWSRLPGLYLAGGSVHPGAGLALAAASGRLCAERVAADLAQPLRIRSR